VPIDDSSLRFPAIVQQATVRPNHQVVLGHQAEGLLSHIAGTGYSSARLAARVDSLRMTVAEQKADRIHRVGKVAGIEQHKESLG
jgi:hypothetical protein